MYKFILINLLLLSGCDDSTGPIDTSIEYEGSLTCTDEIQPAIIIEIKDKNTGESIACNARVILEDNGFSEEIISSSHVECDNTQTLQGADERSGIYNIHIYKEGYLDWSLYNVEVTADQCHVNTVNITAELEK